MELPYELLGKLNDWATRFEDENLCPSYREQAILESIRLLISLTHDEHYSNGEGSFDDCYKRIANECKVFVENGDI